MDKNNIITRLAKKLRDEGLRKTCIGVITYLFDHYYDWKHQLDTYSRVTKEELIEEDRVGVHSNKYLATRLLSLRQAFKKINLPDNKILVDIGSGKGKVLLVASEFGIKDVRGVEFSKILCEIAEKNIEKYKLKTKCNTKFQIIHTDASLYKFTDETIFFLFNPFDEYILKKVLDNIKESLKTNIRESIIIYVNPAKRTFLESNLSFKKVINYNFWDSETAVYEL